MSRRRKGCLGFVLLMVGIAVFPFAWRFGVTTYYGRLIFETQEAPAEQVAITDSVPCCGIGWIQPLTFIITARCRKFW